MQAQKEKRTVKPKHMIGIAAMAIVGTGVYVQEAEASTIHTVRAGDVLETIGRQYGVSVANLRRWNNLQTDVIRIGQQLIVSEPASAQAGGNQTMFVTASALNVRSGAGTNHSIIGSLRRDQSVTVTGTANGWHTIQFNGRTAFVSADFLSSNAPQNNNTGSVQSASGTRTITASMLNVRSGAGTNHGVIGSLTRNQTVTVTGSVNGWYQINHNGRVGFISSNFTSQQVAAGGGSNVQSASGTRVVTANSLNVRSGAGTTHRVIGSLGRNQTVNVSGRNGDWYQINHNGQTGFISRAFVTDAANAPQGGGGNPSTSVNVGAMVSFAQQFIGVPYVWGGSTPAGFDCSGFIDFVFRNNGIQTPRTNVAGYWNNNALFQPITQPQAGDIIFFQNTYTAGPSHMGIMVNSTQFIHASSSRGVTITNVNNVFWSQHFLGFRRLR